MTSIVTTVRILAERSLGESCGQQCVDWAIGMLATVESDDYVARLSSMQQPYNHFQIADLRDRAIDELGLLIGDISTNLTNYAAEILHAAILGKMPLLDALGAVKELCVANDYQSDLYDFYLLYFAKVDLQVDDYQYYWPDANRDSIDSIAQDQIQDFLTAMKSAE